MSSYTENRSTSVIVKRAKETFNCSNCVLKVHPGEFTMSGLMAFDTSKGTRRFFSVAELIAKIYKVKVKGELLFNLRFELCGKCGKYLGEMYKFYQLFIDIGALNSKISDFKGVRGRGQHSSSSAVRSTTQVTATVSTTCPSPSEPIPEIKVKVTVPSTVDDDPIIKSEGRISDSPAPEDPLAISDPPAPEDPLPAPEDPLAISAKSERMTEIDDDETVIEVDPFLIFKSSPPNSPAFSADADFDTEDSEPMDIISPDDCDKDNLRQNSEICNTTNPSLVQTEKGPEQKRPVRPRPKPTPEECPFCKKVLTSMPSLRIHIQAIHQKIRPHKCTICELSFKTRGALTVHLEVHAKNSILRKSGGGSKNELSEEEKSDKCPLCLKGCPTKYALKDHLISGVHNLNLEEARALAGIVNQRVGVVD